MSYGVLASRSGHLLVETVAGAGGSAGDVALDRFQTTWGGTWVPARLTLTSLHVTLMPSRLGQGSRMLTLDLRDLVGVELGGGHVQRVIGLRTARHVASFRCLGAPALAEKMGELAGAARRTRH